MKKMFIIFLVIYSINCFSQNLEMTGNGQSFLVQATQNESWLIVNNNDLLKIYTTDFDLVETVDIGNDIDLLSSVYGAGRDFDDDENIEILYTTMDNSVQSVHLKDINTNEMQVEYIGTASYSYIYSYSSYLGNERIFVINRYNMNSYQYDYSYIYRSGVQNNISNDIISEEKHKILKSYPNPYFLNSNERQGVTIQFELKQAESVNLTIYNMKGQLVDKIIETRKFKAGKHTIFWDGTDINGRKLASGNYIYQLETKADIIHKKMLILK